MYWREQFATNDAQRTKLKNIQDAEKDRNGNLPEAVDLLAIGSKTLPERARKEATIPVKAV